MTSLTSPTPPGTGLPRMEDHSLCLVFVYTLHRNRPPHTTLLSISYTIPLVFVHLKMYLCVPLEKTLLL